MNYININSSDLSDCDECRIKVLVTDGINTNFTVSDYFKVDNDLSIHNFNVVYQNNTGRIFKFILNNTLLGASISDIWWSIDVGQAIINSSMSITLQPKEEALIFAYYNYTNSGNYNVTATAFTNQFIERRSITVVV